jgi:protein-L-isoaspartate O-methyltransferase
VTISEVARAAAAKKAAQVASLQGVKHEAQARANELRERRGQQAASALDNAESRCLLDCHIDGLFPTPPSLARRLVELADIWQGQTVLEPSAGTGNIASAIREAGQEPQCIEINDSLAELLRKRGYSVTCGDFLGWHGQVDRIVMNPPFEDLADCAHVRHAYECLAPGGRLVSVMSAGPFFNQDRKAVEFRAWLDEVGADFEPLPAESFKASGTGVNTYVVTIERGQYEPERR